MGTIQRMVSKVFSPNQAEKSDYVAIFSELCRALEVDSDKESLLRSAQKEAFPIPLIGYLSPAEIVEFRRISHDLYPDEYSPYITEILRLVRGRKAKQLPMDWLYKDDD